MSTVSFKPVRFSPLLICFAVVATLGLGASPARAADSVSGEILDLACYIGRGAKGPAHARCAQTCADHGMPLGVLTEDDKVYLLYPKHGKEGAFEEVKKLAGHDATLTGKLHEKDGLLGMEVHSATEGLATEGLATEGLEGDSSDAE